MKSLVLKEIYCLKFQIFGALLILLFPNIMLALGGGGMAAEGGGTLPNMLSEMGSIIIYGMVNYITITTCSSFVLNTVSDDLKSGWTKIQRVMPLTNGQIIGGKLLASLLIIGMLVLVSLVFNLFGAAVFGIDLEIMIALPFICGLIQVITLSPAFPLAMKIGAKFVTAIYLCIEIVILTGVIVFLTLAFSKELEENVIRAVCYGGLPVIAVGTLAASYAAGRRAFSVDI